MSELSETIGSMPSVPQQEPRPQPPQQKPRPANWGGVIGSSLCAICFLVFPMYAHTDDLGTGIFDGMGLIILLMLFVALCSAIAKRVGKNKPPKALEARPEAGKPQRMRRLNGILFGVVLLLFGVFLLTSPDATNLGDLSIEGLIVLILGIGVIVTTAFGYSRDNRQRAAAEARLQSATQGQQQRSNGMQSIFPLLFLGTCLLAFPLGTSINALGRGIFYGMGLILLLLAMMALGGVISRLMTGVKSPGQ